MAVVGRQQSIVYFDLNFIGLATVVDPEQITNKYFPLSLWERAGVRASSKTPHPNLLTKGEGTKFKVHSWMTASLT